MPLINYLFTFFYIIFRIVPFISVVAGESVMFGESSSLKCYTFVSCFHTSYVCIKNRLLLVLDKKKKIQFKLYAAFNSVFKKAK